MVGGGVPVRSRGNLQGTKALFNFGKPAEPVTATNAANKKTITYMPGDDLKTAA